MAMKKSTLLAVIAMNVAALITLAFVYPEFMVSPGKLSAGHEALGEDCFACHKPFMGADEALCQSCHTLADIGIKDTKGKPLLNRGLKSSFHHALPDPDCMSCHTVHQGSRLTQNDIRKFSHNMLPADIRSECASCHVKPANALHKPLTGNCSGCHNSKAWKPAQFSHATLAKPALAQCQTCHRKPDDRMHRQFNGGCATCHGTRAWEPSTFRHSRYFVLDKNHNTDCATCHTGVMAASDTTDFKQYTCYGCHEHSAARIRAQHQEEGIRDFGNCVKCHRDPQREPEGEGRSGECDAD